MINSNHIGPICMILERFQMVLMALKIRFLDLEKVYTKHSLHIVQVKRRLIIGKSYYEFDS